jgi:hypothetical protein
MKPIDVTGNVVDKNNTTIGVMTKSSSEIRVDVAGFPTIEAYLTAEYTGGFRLIHMDQTYIITDDTLIGSNP